MHVEAIDESVRFDPPLAFIQLGPADRKLATRTLRDAILRACSARSRLRSQARRVIVPRRSAGPRGLDRASARPALAIYRSVRKSVRVEQRDGRDGPSVRP